MSLGISISFGNDEMPAGPHDRCTICKELIIGVKYGSYIQVGGPEEVKYLAQLCKFCHDENFKISKEKELATAKQLDNKALAIAEIKTWICLIHGKSMVIYGENSDCHLRIGITACCKDFEDKGYNYYYSKGKK